MRPLHSPLCRAAIATSLFAVLASGCDPFDETTRLRVEVRNESDSRIINNIKIGLRFPDQDAFALTTTASANDSDFGPSETVTLILEDDWVSEEFIIIRVDGFTADGTLVSSGAAETNAVLVGSIRDVPVEMGPPAIVGDVVVTPLLEECDDGNMEDGDGCNSNALPERGYICSTGEPSVCVPICGDGVIVDETREQCDDGNTAAGDGCDGSCQVETGFACSTGTSTEMPSVCEALCGNGTVEIAVDGYAEECDDGNTDSDDGCSRNCSIENGYVCTGSTPSICEVLCGNGLIDLGEQCDTGESSISGADLADDGCLACFILDGFSCSDTEPTVCAATCGNGALDELDDCDDGNIESGDGCSSVCVVENGFSCETVTDSPSQCFPCGDGVLDPTEICDDGNVLNGDGCSADCQAPEPGFICQSMASDELADTRCDPICNDGQIAGEETCDFGLDVVVGCSACQTDAGYSCDAVGCATVCGDGIVAGDETCDLGANAIGCTNCETQAGFFCTAFECFTADGFCGDGIVNAGESCDDNNSVSGDGCDVDCQIEEGYTCSGVAPSQCAQCGDSSVSDGEECDPGTDLAGCEQCQIRLGWACDSGPSTSSCQPGCGDGILSGDEACDDGNLNAGDGCSGQCQVEVGFSCPAGSACTPVCGDGNLSTMSGAIANGGEECDDGGLVPGDGCAADCTVEPGFVCGTSGCSAGTATCGNAIVEFPNETCDDGNSDDADGCSSACVLDSRYICPAEGALCIPRCGDGIMTAYEECDDGNDRDGDGCSAVCAQENGWSCSAAEQDNPSMCAARECGDQIVVGLEQCDDGNLISDDGCDLCTKPTGCGDGEVEVSEGDTTPTSEQCDDGNTVGGDGCDATCQVEDGYVCIEAPSICYEF